MSINQWEPEKRTFPHRYKQYKVLEKMLSEGSIRYTDVVRLAFNLSNGEGAYDADTVPITTKWNGSWRWTTGGNPHRGYWSGVFKGPGYYGWSGSNTGWMTRLANKGEDGKYRINEAGMEVYLELHKKYKGVTPEQAKAMQNEI